MTKGVLCVVQVVRVLRSRTCCSAGCTCFTAEKVLCGEQIVRVQRHRTCVVCQLYSGYEEQVWYARRRRVTIENVLLCRERVLRCTCFTGFTTEDVLFF